MNKIKLIKSFAGYYFYKHHADLISKLSAFYIF